MTPSKENNKILITYTEEIEVWTICQKICNNSHKEIQWATKDETRSSNK